MSLLLDALQRASKDKERVALAASQATLADVLAGTEAEARKHPAAYPMVHVTSAETKLGIEELRAAVLADAQV